MHVTEAIAAINNVQSVNPEAANPGAPNPGAASSRAANREAANREVLKMAVGMALKADISMTNAIQARPVKREAVDNGVVSIYSHHVSSTLTT